MRKRAIAWLAPAALAAMLQIQPARADLSLFGGYWDNVARAAKQNDAQHVLRLVGPEGNPNQTDEDGRTGLHYAAMNGNLQIVAILIRAGANLDVRDPLGDTPLHWAVARKHLEIAQLLLDAGAPVDPENKDGITPLMMAAREGDLEILRALLAKGADVRKTDFTGRDAIGWAEDGRSPAVKRALERALAAHR